MTMGKSTWDLQTHIDTLREWETSHQSYQGFTHFQPRQSLSQGVPMDVDKKKSTTVRAQNLPKLTPQIRDELRKKGACFRCRKPGHMSRECPGPNSTLVSTSSSKMTSNKGKNRREVVEEIDEEKADESEEEEQPKQEKKKVRKAKATSSIASSSCTPIIETDEEEEPPSYQSACVSIMRTLAQFPPTQHSQLADSLADDEGF